MLRYVSDLWIMGVAAVREGCALSRWLREEGYARQASCGISMGGHMAAQVGVLSGEPMAIVCFVTPHSAAAVFTEGAPHALLCLGCPRTGVGRRRRCTGHDAGDPRLDGYPASAAARASAERRPDRCPPGCLYPRGVPFFCCIGTGPVPRSAGSIRAISAPFSSIGGSSCPPSAMPWKVLPRERHRPPVRLCL